VGNNLKKALIAIILFTLILASCTVLSTPRVKADTSEVTVLSYSWYTAPSNTVQAVYVNDLIVVGEVEIVGSHPLDKVFVSGGAYNATGGLLGSAEGQVFGNYLVPGQKAPFYMDFTPEYSATPTVGDEYWTPFVTNVTVNVAFAEDSNETNYPTLSFAAGSLTGALVNSTGAFTLTGTVQNTGTINAGNVFVVSTFYNTSGTVIGMNFTDFVSTSLAPGNVARFTATPTDNTNGLSNAVSNYSAFIQSFPETTQATPTPTPYQQPTSTPTPSTQPTVTPAPISANVIYTVVGVVAIILVILAVLLLLKRRKNSELDLPPPPPPPPPP
jgi:hypothetical protein